VLQKKGVCKAPWLDKSCHSECLRRVGTATSKSATLLDLPIVALLKGVEAVFSAVFFKSFGRGAF